MKPILLITKLLLVVIMLKLRRYDDLINHYFYAEDSVKSAQIPNSQFIEHQICSWRNIGTTLKFKSIRMRMEMLGLVSDVKFVNTPNEEIDEIGNIDSKNSGYFEG